MRVLVRVGVMRTDGEEAADGRVLVVDDDPTVREVVVSYLRAAGHTVTEAEDGEDGPEGDARDPADLVVLDLMLPGIDGLEVCRRLRETQRHPGDHADGARGRDRPGRGPGAGRRRLRHQAVQPARAGAARRLGAAAYRRAEPPAGGPVRSTATSWSTRTRHVVTRDGGRVPLTAREFDLLRFFVSPPGQGVLARRAAAARSGAGRSVTSRRSPCTYAACARRSRPTRRVRCGW